LLRTSDLEYDLPETSIATVPAEPRDAARLMVVDPVGSSVLHRSVRDLPEFLREGDLLVLNTTRVLPARLLGRRADTGGRVEGLYLRSDGAGPDARWIVMLRAKRPRENVRISLTAEGGALADADLVLESPVEGEPGTWRVRVLGRDGEAPGEVLARVGLTPLPPYILKAREHAHRHVADVFDRERYQTVFAGTDAGSVAASTAGLHLTPDLLAKLRAKGIGTAEVVLHVGTGTFKPVETEFVEQHPMHTEWCFMSETTRDAIARTRQIGGRVIALGTTSARTVEAFLADPQQQPGQWVQTRILITPGYTWRGVDGLLTNFHLPRSTLMAMVGARLGGVDRLKSLYAEAIGLGYRFYSYGDAMLICGDVTRGEP